MALLIITIPLMLVALAIAVIPLLATSRAQHRAARAATNTIVVASALTTDGGADEPVLPLAA
jgi:hypothetical protein